jgi:hypothetical protein
MKAVLCLHGVEIVLLVRLINSQKFVCYILYILEDIPFTLLNIRHHSNDVCTVTFGSAS